MALNGCPIFLLKAMLELSRLASLYQKSALREWSVFDDMTFKPIIGGLLQKVSSEKVDLRKVDGFSCEKGTTSRQDCYHCMEAWRCAVLLYCHRVFDRQKDEHTPSTISQLAHMVIDHVRWISEGDNMRKQLMIPVFLAGAEMRTEGNRGFVRGYSEQWAQQDSFGQFQYVLDVLGEIWQHVDTPEGTSTWWGRHLNRKRWTDVMRGCEVWVT
jgi:hypothetical protein